MNKFFFILFLIYFILIFQIPGFVGDEGYYSISITDAINNGIKPYLLFFEIPAFWKPPLMVNIYALIAIPLIELFNLDIVYAYRIGSVIFSTLNVILVYLISKEFVGKEKAKWITIIYALNPIILIFGTKIFMETMAMTFVFAGILGCIKYKEKNEIIWLGLIPLSIFGASYTKSFTIGIMSILLCGLYFFLFNFKKIDKFVILCLIGILACVGFAYYSGFPEMYFKLFMEDFFTNRLDSINTNNLFLMLSSIIYLIPLFLVGLKKIDIKDKKNIFMIVWFLPLIPIMIKTPFVWYAFYFILPIIYLAIRGIETKGIDLIIIIFLIFLGVYFTYENFMGHINLEENTIQKIIEQEVGGKCIYVMGGPEMQIYSYLYHNNYNFNFILNGNFEKVNGEIKNVHYFEKIEIEKLFSLDEKCIENKKNIELGNQHYKSCNENCKIPEYILINSEPKIDIEKCEIFKEFQKMILWKCLN
jgi:4-amino-4-deoxy-L-arabinose transferase-like glycosyltransferase